MGIIKRVARLIQADVHGLLDVLEDPREILKQSMREMEEELLKHEAEQRMLAEREQRLQAQEADGARQLAAIGAEIKLCLEAGNETLARAAVRRKLEVERASTKLAAARAGVEQQRTEHAKRLQEAKSCYEILKDKVSLFPEQDSMASSYSAASEQPVSDSEVEIALLKEQANLRSSKAEASV